MPKINVKDKRKQQLIDANMLSIAKRGLVDTTISHVADGANLSRGIVNFYFTSKEKMMQETLAYLIGEQTTCWQEALASNATAEPVAKIEAVMRAVMGDKLCSARRLAVLSAFIGHAGTHAVYARIITAGDDLFITQMKQLWQQAGLEPAAAGARARQMLAVVRGHHTMTFINPDSGKPSQFIGHWSDVMNGWGSGQKPKAVVKEKAVVSRPVPPPDAKPAKKTPSAPVPGQMDFGDLFSRT